MRVAEALLTKEKISGEEFEVLFAGETTQEEQEEVAEPLVETDNITEN